jgi:hypothetical protein
MDEVRLMGVDAPVEFVDISSSSSGDSDFRLRGVTVPEEVTLARCLFSRNEWMSLSKIDR